MEIDWVTPTLALGPGFKADEGHRLVREHGITCVVDLRGEACHPPGALERFGIEVLRLPTPDMHPPSHDSLERGVAWISSALGEGRRVLVHCQFGIGRSALLVLCVLVASGQDPEAALTRLKQTRAVVSPSPAQLEAFIAFVRRHGARRRTVPTFDALARIAYATSQ